MNRKRSVIIRADGSKAIGMGHMSRAIQLYQCFTNNGHTTSILTKKDFSGDKYFSNRDLKVNFLPSSISMEEELSTLYEYIDSWKPCILILDMLDAENYNLFLQNLVVKDCVSILITDESSQTVGYSDIILNGNPSQLTYDYSKEAGRYLVGPKYFIMDPAYQSISRPTPSPKRVKNVFVSLGGSDKNGLLFLVLRALERLPHIDLLIASSSSANYSEDLSSYLETSHLPSKLYMDQISLAPLWQEVDFAITAGGNTLFERIATRTPGATICQESKQMDIANTFQALGVNWNFGVGKDLGELYLTEQLDTFFKDDANHKRQHDLAPQLVDGNGLNRFYRAINDLMGESPSSL